MTDRRIRELEAEIGAQRDQLVETLDHLTHKLDLKTQADERAAGAKARSVELVTRFRSYLEHLGHAQLRVAGGGALVATAGLVWCRRRRR